MFSQELLDSTAEDMELVDGYLRQYMEDEKAGDPLKGIMQSVLETKGKKMRPMLLVISGMFGPEYTLRRERLCRLGAVVEMIHMASLIHDDVIDDSPMRRGKPTVQSAFGKDMAVYTGDYMLSRMMYLLLEGGFVESGKILARCVSDMCSGELLQHKNQFCIQSTEEEYFTAVRGKTAAIFKAAALTGAMETDCSPKLQQMLGDLAENLGILFQLRDDLLDFLSDEQIEGKPVHNDFRAGIYTLPILYTLRNPRISQRLRQVIAGMENGGDPAQAGREMERMVKEAGGISYAGQVMEDYGRRINEQLHRLPSCPANGMLRSIVNSAKALPPG